MITKINVIIGKKTFEYPNTLDGRQKAWKKYWVHRSKGAIYKEISE